MSKMLKIEGVKEIIINACMSCPFNYDCGECKLHTALHGYVGIHEKPVQGEARFDKEPDMCLECEESVPKNCPLPEYVNENEHTAPDGTELVAAVNDKGANCDICHYQWIQDNIERCTRGTAAPGCCACDRKDKRNIGWAMKKNKLAGDRK